EQRRSLFGFDKNIASRKGEPLGAQVMENGLGALRGAIGTPNQLRDLITRYEHAGIDQIIFVSQCGRNKHDHICESLKLFANEVMGEFHERAPEIEAKKEEELKPYIEQALKRREPARQSPADYVIGAAAQI
ncbi:MAG: LLM class flavin-dependent oxidoreductase, partial [Acidimicrobiales bacterium]|nr:LLM class flavin-dependent oxidoreductase [Acidimicrobiales bacterium]